MPLSTILKVSGLGATSKAVARSIFSATTSCRRLSVKSTIPSSLPIRMAWPSLMSSSLRISFLTVGIHPHDLDQRDPGLAGGRRPVLGRRQQLLGDDRLEVERQVLTHRRVHVLREQVEDAADRRGGAGGVDRAEDQVAGLGRVHGGVERLAVAHLADQDDVGVLPHGVLQRRVPVDDVDADLALIDDALIVLEGEFDRVLDRDDVAALALVDVLEHRGDGRGLAAAGDAGQDDDPLVVAGDLAEDRRQAEALEVGDRRVDAAGDQAEPARAGGTG